MAKNVSTPNIVKETAHLTFIHSTPGYRVYNKHNSDQLGIIYYFPRWRKFIFEPYIETVYDSQCLTDIAFFLAELTHGVIGFDKKDL